MKHIPEYIEGPEAWARFMDGIRKVLTVSHNEIQRRIEAERAKSALNPNRRGPKRKAVAPAPDVQSLS
jgi:hypothetical protein